MHDLNHAGPPPDPNPDKVPASDKRAEPEKSAGPADQDSHRGPGRPTVLDDACRQMVCAPLTAGCSRTEAVRYAGCSLSALKRAVARDPEFAARLKQAEVAREVIELDKVRRASGKSWRAATWLLRYYNPRRYNPDRRDVYTHEQVLKIVRGVGAKLKRSSFDVSGMLGGPDRLEEVLHDLSTRQGLRRYLKNP